MDKGAARRLRALVKDELSAVEAYLHALESLSEEPESGEIRRLQAEHEQAAAVLRDRSVELGLKPPAGGGAWRAWTRSTAGALGALLDGEERCIRDYEGALREEALPPELRALIGDTLLPAARRRLPALEALSRRGPPGGMSYNADQGYGGAGQGRDVA